MRFFSEFSPILVEETSSLLSGPIKVVDYRGEKRLVIDNLVQSISPEKSAGHKVWGRLAAYPLRKKKDLTILLLGFGGGTVAHLIARNLNPKKMIGVEIDPVIVELGQKYFNTGKIRNLEIIVEDARSFVDRAYEKFDFIVIDTFRGRFFPIFMEDKSFLKKIRSILIEDGVLVFNRIFRSSQPPKRLAFLKLLKSVFGKVSEEVIEGPADAKNYLYWVLPQSDL